jgi:hypothetical protein
MDKSNETTEGETETKINRETERGKSFEQTFFLISLSKSRILF